MSERRSALQEELLQCRPFESPRHEAFLSLLRTAAVVKRPIAKVIEEQGLSLAQYNVLRILRGAGEAGLPTLSIRERLIEEAAGITRLIDKLEASGFVRRERSTTVDRRQVICHITSSGRDLLGRLDAPVTRGGDLALAMLDDERLAELVSLLDEIRAGNARAARPAEYDDRQPASRP